MQIISTRGEKRLVSADIQRILAETGQKKGTLLAKLYSSVTFSRLAGESGAIVWDTVYLDNAAFWRPATSVTKLWIPQEGWYLANAYLSSTTNVASKQALQIHNSRLASFFAYDTDDFENGSTTYPNWLCATGVAYLYPGDSVYCYWACSAAITARANQATNGFGLWKIGP